MEAHGAATCMLAHSTAGDVHLNPRVCSSRVNIVGPIVLQPAIVIKVILANKVVQVGWYETPASLASVIRGTVARDTQPHTILLLMQIDQVRVASRM